jgi:tRNA threonylcarbamoyladenosine biosynthesis protein TsaE
MAERGNVNVRQTTETSEETAALGERLAEELVPGDVVGLVGELGAGKTCFVKGVAVGLGVVGNVKSPSYTVINVYEGGRLPLYHIDLYRVSSSGDFDSIGLEEYIYSEGISVIEWVDNVVGLESDCTVMVTLQYAEAEGAREIEIKRVK